MEGSPALRLAAAGQRFVAVAEARGLPKDVAEWFREDSLVAEPALRDLLFYVARSVLKRAFEDLDDHGASLTVEDQLYHRVVVTRGEALTLFGRLHLSVRAIVHRARRLFLPSAPSG